MSKTNVITRFEIAKKLSKSLGIQLKESEKLVAAIFESLTDAIASGRSIELRGFGSFRLRHRDARKGRNPKTGEPVSIPPKTVSFFKPGKELREGLCKKRTQL